MKAVESLRAAFPPGKKLSIRNGLERHLAQQRGRATFVRVGFIVLVLLPTLGSAVYYGLIASNRYVSESEFAVRGISSSHSSGLEVLFRTIGMSRTVDDSNSVEMYMTSRDAVRALEARLPLREMFSRGEGDVLARFPRFWRGDSFEMLYEYYLQRVLVVQDATKGLIQLRVISFRPEDSFQIAQALLGLAEGMVNRMNERAESNVIKDAREDEALAKQALVSAQLELTTFRNRELLVDPSQSSLKAVETIASMSKDLSETLAQIEQASKMAPENPTIPVWEAQVQALRTQVAAERAKLAGGSDALAGKVAEYEGLTLLRDLAEKRLEAAATALAVARQTAERKKIYIEEVVSPNVADESTEPQRLRSIATVFVLGFGAFAMIWLVRAGASEHAL